MAADSLSDRFAMPALGCLFQRSVRERGRKGGRKGERETGRQGYRESPPSALGGAEPLQQGVELAAAASIRGARLVPVRDGRLGDRGRKTVGRGALAICFSPPSPERQRTHPGAGTGLHGDHAGTGWLLLLAHPRCLISLPVHDVVPHLAPRPSLKERQEVPEVDADALEDLLLCG